MMICPILEYIQRRELSLSEDVLQERAPTLVTGSLYDGSFRFTYDAAGNITGEEMKEETITPCIMFSSVGEHDYSSYFEVLIDGEMLEQITFSLVLPKHDYQTKQAVLTQSCPQEVKVVCVP